MVGVSAGPFLSGGPNFAVDDLSVVASFANVPSQVSALWQQARAKLFDGDEEGVKLEELQKVVAHAERSVLRVTAFAVDLRSADDFDLLQKPVDKMVEAYCMLLGTLTCMGLGRRSGRTLRRDILDYGDRVSQQWAAVEKVLKSRDAKVVKEHLSKRTGMLLETVKKMEKTPRANHTAVKKAMVKQIHQLRDATREVASRLEDPDFPGCGQSDACPERHFCAALEAFEKVLKTFLTSEQSSSIEAGQMEAGLDSLVRACELVDETATSLGGDGGCDDDDVDGDFDDSDDEAGKLGGSAGIISPAQRLDAEERAQALETLETLREEIRGGALRDLVNKAGVAAEGFEEIEGSFRLLAAMLEGGA